MCRCKENVWEPKKLTSDESVIYFYLWAQHLVFFEAIKLYMIAIIVLQRKERVGR